MSTYRVPKCGRHFVKFDAVTIYPVLVVARTERNVVLQLYTKICYTTSIVKSSSKDAFFAETTIISSQTNRQKRLFLIYQYLIPEDMVLTINARTLLETYFLLIYSASFWPDTARNPFSQIFLQEGRIQENEPYNL